MTNLDYKKNKNLRIFSFDPIIDQQSEILILGTMPSIISLQSNEYYGNKQNIFWKLIFEIFHSPFAPDYSSRKDFLLQNRLALWDNLQFCEREGSLDSKIKQESPNDFNALFSKYPAIRHLIFNGKASEKFFKKYNKQLFTNIQSFTLLSTSPVNASKTYNQKLEEWKILKTLRSSTFLMLLIHLCNIN